MRQKLIDLPSKLISPFKQIILYFALVFGVFFSDILMQFRIDNKVDIFQLFAPSQLGRLIICSLIAIAIMPSVYQKLVASTTGSRFDNTGEPFIIQFCIFFQNGVFWSYIFSSAGKMLGAP